MTTTAADAARGDPTGASLVLGIASVITFGTTSLAAGALAYWALRRDSSTRLGRWTAWISLALSAIGLALFGLTLAYFQQEMQPNLWDYLDPANYESESFLAFALVWGGIIAALGLIAWLIARRSALR